ncbi:phosphonoacetaldehyde hydrolase [Kyrpidia spormannii]|nr:phosphonoacetaldehyde hydrolase [Kyrpidia spormannii]
MNQRLEVQAVVFDWAGTVVDDGCVAPVAAFRDVFGRRGIEVAEEEIRRFMGLAKKDHLRALLRLEAVRLRWRAALGREPGEADVDDLYNEFVPIQRAVLAEHADLIPGVEYTVLRLRERGIRIGSTTGYTSEMMEVLVPEAARRGFCPDAVVSSSDVPEGRPAPWMCYENALRLRVFPMATMVKVGDTPGDMEEGRNAGMWSIGILEGGSVLGLTRVQREKLPELELERRMGEAEAELRRAGAHYVLRRIDELQRAVDEINQRLSQGECPCQ